MSDALAMLDELRGLFATGELAAARRMCEAVLRELVEEVGGPIAGEATIMRPIVRDVRELGPLTERAIEAFREDVPMALARVVQLGSLAAELAGDPRSNERRARLFETPGLEMIELPIEVEHPRTGELVRQIPRLSADDMPTPYFPPRDAFGAPTTIDDPLQAAYRELDDRIARHRRLVELQAPARVVVDELDRIQAAVQRFFDEATRPFETRHLDGWGELDMPVHTALAFRGHDGTVAELRADPSDTPSACIWLTEGRVAVRRDDVLELRSLPDWNMLYEVPLGAGATLQSCDHSGRYLVITSNANRFEAAGVAGLGCFDLETREWLTELPAHMVAASFGVDDEHGTDGRLYEHRRGGCLALNRLGNRPKALGWARGNTAVLLSGDHFIHHAEIRSTIDGMIEISSQILQARYHDDAPLLMVEGKPPYTFEPTPYAFLPPLPCAIARHDERWRFVLSRTVADADHTLFRIGFKFDAAAFSPDGTQLLLIASDALIIDVASMTVVWRQSM